MRKYLALLCLLPIVAWGQPPTTAPKPLQVNANGVLTFSEYNGNKVTIPSGVNLGGGTKAQRGIANDIYLAVRTDSPPCSATNICGSGTAEDPFDASGTDGLKYTTLLTTYQPNYTFHYAPGTYYTLGWRFGVRKSAGTNVKHYGAGIGQTIIRLTGASNTTDDGTVFASDYNARSDGFELHDLSINCDATAQPKWSSGVARFVTGVNVRGSNITISGVEIYGFGTKSVGTECFALFVAPTVLAGTYENNLVEKCIIRTPVTGNLDGLTSIAVTVVGTGATGRNLVARGNSVDLTGNDFLYSMGVNADVAEDNDIKGCSVGSYAEPAGTVASFGTFRNNRYTSCERGFYSLAHAGATTPGFHLEGNIFKDVTTPIEMTSENATVVYRDLVIKNNRWVKSDGTLSTARAVRIIATNKAVVENNIFDSSNVDSIHVESTSQSVAENRNSAGSLLGSTINTVTTQQRQFLGAGFDDVSFLILNAGSLLVNHTTGITGFSIIAGYTAGDNSGGGIDPSTGSADFPGAVIVGGNLAADSIEAASSGFTVDSSGNVTAVSFIGDGSDLIIPTSAIATGLMDTARLGTGTANSTKFLRGDQTWQTGISYSDSASLAAALSDETGFTTGAQLVFNINPVLYYPLASHSNVWSRVTQGNLTTVSADATITLSGSIASGQKFGGVINGHATNTYVLTLPANFKNADRKGESLSTLTVGPGRHEWSVIYDGTNYNFAGVPNFAVTVATLPASPSLGDTQVITDGDAALAWGATAVNSGAGATKYLVWYNGTNYTVVGK